MLLTTKVNKQLASDFELSSGTLTLQEKSFNLEGPTNSLLAITNKLCTELQIKWVAFNHTLFNSSILPHTHTHTLHSSYPRQRLNKFILSRCLVSLIQNQCSKLTPSKKSSF